MSDLNVKLVISAVNRTTQAVRGAIGGLGRLIKSAQDFDQSMQRAANLRQAAEGVSRFARATRNALGATIAPADQFEARMARVRGILMPTASEFQILTKEARRLGREVGEFSATQAAEGMIEFAIAGWSTEQILKALPTTLDLSTAGAMDLGQTVSVMTGIMGGFGIEAKDATRVSDVLTAAFTNSKTTLDTLNQTMAYAAPVASSLGISFEEVAALTGLLGDANIDASRAGTTLNAMLGRLAAPRGPGLKFIRGLGLDLETVVDGTKRMRSPLAILDQLRGKIESLGPVARMGILKKIFGLEAAPGVAQLMNVLGKSPDKINKMVSAIENADGRTLQFATDIRKTAENETAQMTSAMESLGITVGDTTRGPLSNFKKMTADIAAALDKWAGAHESLTKAIGLSGVGIAGLATGIAGALFTLGAATSAFAIMGRGLAAVQFASFALRYHLVAGLMPTLAKVRILVLTSAAPWYAWVVVIGAVGLAITEVIKHWEELSSLDIMETLKGIADVFTGGEGLQKFFASGGVLGGAGRVLGELFDPRALLKDIGVLGADKQALPAGAAAQQATVNGLIRVAAESGTKVTATEMTGGLELSSSLGSLLPVGG